MNELRNRIRRQQGIGQPPTIWRMRGAIGVSACRGKPMDESFLKLVLEQARRLTLEKEAALQRMAALAGSFADGHMVVLSAGFDEDRYCLDFEFADREPAETLKENRVIDSRGHRALVDTIEAGPEAFQ